MSAQADRLTAITSQLVGDISRLPGVTMDKATEGQLVQLLTDAFEQVGHIALDEQEIQEDGRLHEEAQRQFQSTEGQVFNFAGSAATFIGDD